VTEQPVKFRRKRFDPVLILVFIGIICFSLFLARILLMIPFGQNGLTEEVAGHQELSGVDSPVTAVLLNFRGYDTLLEVIVLLLAVIGVWSFTRAPIPAKERKVGSVQLGMVRLLAPLMCLVGVYLVWQGSHLAGGAFQGGAVIGGAIVLMLISELPWLNSIPSFHLRLGLLFGPFVFVLVALGCLVSEGTFLTYPQNLAGPLLILIESACALSIGLTLASLFAGGRPKDDLSVKKQGKIR
jgi:multisubunit Na+/H+ antiporter MnhB subunit